MTTKTNRKNRVTAQQKRNRDLLWMVYRFHIEYSPTDWLKENPEATLGQLKSRIEEATEQCYWYGDDPIPDHEGYIPDPLAEELAEWELPEDEDDQTFSYRVENLQEIAEHIGQLIECLGSDFPVVELWPYGERWYKWKLEVTEA